MKSLGQLSLDYDFSYFYFAYMKNKNREKFDFIFGFDENKDISIKKYIAYAERIISKMEEILLRYPSNKSDFGRLLAKNGLTIAENLGAVWFSTNRAIDAIRYEDQHFISIKYNALKRWKKIIEINGGNCD